MSACAGGGVALDRSETGIDGGAFAGLGMGGELNPPPVVSVFSAKCEAGQQLTLMGEGWSRMTDDRGKA